MTMTSSDRLAVSAVVTDPDGIDDLIGGTLTTTDGASTFGAFATDASEGAYSISLTCKESACVVDTEKKMKDLNTSVECKGGRPNDLDKIFNGMRECEERVAKREIVPTMTRYRDAMCACKDRDCAYGVSEGSKNALRVDFEHYEPTAEETKQLADIAKQAECLTRATGGEGSAR
jgi:hypothetical protein